MGDLGWVVLQQNLSERGAVVSVTWGSPYSILSPPNLSLSSPHTCIQPALESPNLGQHARHVTRPCASSLRIPRMTGGPTGPYSHSHTNRDGHPGQDTASTSETLLCPLALQYSNLSFIQSCPEEHIVVCPVSIPLMELPT